MQYTEALLDIVFTGRGQGMEEKGEEEQRLTSLTGHGIKRSTG